MFFQWYADRCIEGDNAFLTRLVDELCQFPFATSLVSVSSVLMVTGKFPARVGTLLYVSSSLERHFKLKEIDIPLKSMPKEDTLHHGRFFQWGN